MSLTNQDKKGTASNSSEPENGVNAPFEPTSYPHLPGRLANDPPTYSDEDGDLHNQIRNLTEDLSLPILAYPKANVPPYRRDEDVSDTERRCQDIVTMYFDAIETKKDEVVAALVDSGTVTTETTNRYGRTPLLAAVKAGHIRTVQQLMDFEADVNAFGVVQGLPGPYYHLKRRPNPHDIILRTPLMVAAEEGNLTIVKLLIETYGADDSIIAPDGELALRLASEKGHQEIVDYLPARRGGGFKRWKTKHRRGMLRARRAVESIGSFFRILLWTVPRTLIWDVPKHLLVLPIRNGVKWLYQHRAELPQRILLGIKHYSRKLFKFLKHLPEGLWELTKGLATFIWEGVKNFPHAVRIFISWLWKGIKEIGTAISNVFARFIAFLHTLLGAILSFFRNITLKDVWNGLVAFVRAVVVDGPRKLWQWICKLEDMTLRVFEALWGCFGGMLWMVLRGIVEVLIYVPKKLWDILVGCGMSIAGAFREVLVWIDLKRS